MVLQGQPATCLFGNQPGDVMVSRADVLITVGFDPVEYDPRLWNTDPERTVIHIDEIAADLDAHYQPSLELRGDIAATVCAVVPALSGLRLPPEADVSAQRTASDSSDDDARSHPDTDVGVNPAALAVAIGALVDDSAIIASDIGSNYIYTARHLRTYQPSC